LEIDAYPDKETDYEEDDEGPIPIPAFSTIERLEPSDDLIDDAKIGRVATERLLKTLSQSDETLQCLQK
jgi:hypothetical protein